MLTELEELMNDLIKWFGTLTGPVYMVATFVAEISHYLHVTNLLVTIQCTCTCMYM